MSLPRKLSSLLAAGALVATGAVIASGPAAADPRPGNPGVPSDPHVVFEEDFENGSAPTPGLLADYVGDGGQRYTATGGWADPAQCNGIVTRAVNGNHPACGGDNGNQLRALAYALGTVNGTPDPYTNFAVSAYTAGDPGANEIEFATATPVPLSTANRFLSFSVNVVAFNCYVTGGQPQLQFAFEDGAIEQTVGSPINPCQPGTAVTAQPYANGFVGTWATDEAVLFSGDELGVVMRNLVGSGVGNDHAFDDIRVLDTTPQLDKQFTPTTSLTGAQTALTFTITNTSELGRKAGWSFTDALPAGVEVATSGGSTTCEAATVTASAGTGEIAVTDGTIAAGATSCTVTVQVRGTEAGGFTNGPGNITTVGLELPGESTLTATDAATPADDCTDAEARATERFWFFGNRAAIDFGATGTTATPFVGPAGSETSEGTTVVTDVSGNLRFWSNGRVVIDATGAIMPNGTGLLGNDSSPQTVAAFPSPENPNQFFVVATSTDVAVGPNTQLTYSVVDMTLRGGLGDVTDVKNVPLGPVGTASEALTAIPNADGSGYWVLTYTNNSPNVLAYEFDSDGPVTGVPVVSVMPSNHFNGYGSLAFSADRTQLALLSAAFATTGVQPAVVRLLAFDAASGLVQQTTSWDLPTGGGNMGYSADFSPGGDYLYATRIFGGAQLYRFDLTDVEAAGELVGPVGASGGQVRRGPDGRMYVANVNAGNLSVVNTPDAVDPGLVTAGFALPAGAVSRFGLPQMVTGCPLSTGMELLKSSALQVDANDNGLGDAGDTVRYTFTVTNTGTTTITGVSIDDPFLEAADVDVTPASQDLAPNTSIVFTADYTLTQADIDAGEVENIATATGTGPDGGTVDTPPGDDTFVPAPRVPGLTILKETDRDDDDGPVDVGDVITYTFTVENTGNVTMTGVTVDDPRLTAAGVSVSPGPVTLLPGDEQVFTAAYTVTTADILTGTVVNEATATGTSPLGGYESPESGTSTSTVDADPRLQITKSGTLTTDVDGDGLGDVGDVITYSFLVENLGNTDFTDIVVDDPMIGEGPVAVVGDLAAGASATVTATYTVTQDDVDGGETLRNVATATGSTPDPDDPTGDPLLVTSPPGDTTIDLDFRPELTVVKSATPSDENGNGFADVGETITYSFLVENTGTTTVENVRVLDPMVSFADADPITLAPGESVTITAEPYAVTQADVDNGGVLNVASARGNVPGGGELDSEESEVVVEGPPGQPGLQVVKTAQLDDANGNGLADPGETIVYSFAVTNTGNVTMFDIRVVDPMLEGLLPGPVEQLAPGVTVTLTADPYTVRPADVRGGAVVNVATVTGTTLSGQAFESDPAQVSLDAPQDVAGGVLPSIGSAVNGLMVLAGLLALLLGMLLLAARRETGAMSSV